MTDKEKIQYLKNLKKACRLISANYFKLRCADDLTKEQIELLDDLFSKFDVPEWDKILSEEFKNIITK